MSIGALVQQVEQVLNRGHLLFGEPTTSSAGAAGESGSALATASRAVRTGQRRISGLSGATPLGYTRFATDAGPALDTAADTDTQLNRTLDDSAEASRRGRHASASVVNGAALDTTALTPSTNTPSGQRALITALRTRLTQQQHVIDVYETRSARMAVLVRALRYGQLRPVGPPGGMAGGSGPPTGALSRCGAPATGLAGNAIPRAADYAMPVRQSAPTGPAGTPLGALTVNSGPREVAAAIIHEAHRRGYSPYQTTAILADAMQESKLNPKARSPNGLWESIFQQDSSYPGRRNPNLAIAEFFNRLDRHGGPSSRDIWKSIFWLQQRPGDPSADVAFTRGRRAYLSEIQSQHRAAVTMYHDIACAAAL